jgi:hypothetical protein
LVNFIGTPVNCTLAFAQRALSILNTFKAAIDSLLTFLQPFFLPSKLGAPALHFGFGLVAELNSFLLCLDEYVLLLRFSLSQGTLCLGLGRFELGSYNILAKEVAQPKAD